MFQLKTAALIALACFGFLPIAQAVTPAPDGDYGNGNTAEGGDALFSLTAGKDNTALGFNALYSNTLGSENSATGSRALYSNVNGAQNTATGSRALYTNTSGARNTAIGTNALLNNTTGNSNTATGINALLNNTTGEGNMANGGYALFSNTTGDVNTATGFDALFSNTTGTGNTASGLSALGSNTTGSDNTVDGVSALLNNTTGNNNIALGANAGSNLTTGDNNIDIGNFGVAAESNTIRIGTSGTQTRAFMAGIYGTIVSGTPVKVNSSGQLGVTPSSARFKRDIRNMERASDVLLALRPVTFHYKREIDREGSPQFGLVAEEVEKVSRDLVIYDAEGKPYTVRYDAVNAMLLNEFLEEHATVEQLKSKAAK